MRRCGGSVLFVGCGSGKQGCAGIVHSSMEGKFEEAQFKR
jgi:hypothetical protein